MTTYTMPSVCAKCGCADPGESYQIASTRVSLSPWTILGIFVRRIAYNTRTITFAVPLCAKCKRDMAQSKQMRLFMQVLGLLIFVGVCAFLVLDSSTTQKFREYLFDFGGILALVLILGSPLMVPSLGSYDGKYFRFPNKAFQERFAGLNPRLVKKR